MKMNNLSNHLSCYHCFEVFDSNQIQRYTDNGRTSICPFCEIDAVTEVMDDEELQEMHSASFGTCVGYDGVLVKRK